MIHESPAANANVTPLELFLGAFRRAEHPRPAVWLMRQAGRYLPEYRALRGEHTFLEMCKSPDLAVEVSLLPHRIFDVDAVIVFYDILVPLDAMGASLAYTEEGPRFAAPIRDREALAGLRELDPATDTPGILETIRRVRLELEGKKPVLGFAGAPFTLASYLIEGRVGSRGVETIMRVLHSDPAFLHDLLARLARMTASYLRAQIEAGAHAVQLFDTWAGRLGVAEYREFALPYQKLVLDEVASAGVPGIIYVRDGNHILEELGASGATGVSIEWRVSPGRARAALGPDLVIQGNLDPAALFATPESVRRRVLDILEERRGDPAYIFNLGHGVLPGTPVESVRAAVETVKNFE